jgi:integrase
VVVGNASRPVLVGDGEDLVPANQFLRALELRGLSPHTLRAYAYDLAILYRWLGATARQLTQLTSAELLEFVALQRELGAEPCSINRRLSTACLLFRFCSGRAIDAGSRATLPSPHYKGPGRDHQLGLHRLRRRSALKLRVKQPDKLVEPLSPRQVRSFLRSLRRYRDLGIVHLMLLCGLRSSEVLRLEVGDIVFADSRVRVHGKGQRERTLPLPDLLRQLLQQYLELERPRRCTTRHLFVVLQGQRRGQPMTIAGLRSLFRHRRRRPPLAIANAHRFRHTFGADMARAGVRVFVLQRLMGHASALTTLHYIRLSMADVADEYRRALAQLDHRYASESDTE